MNREEDFEFSDDGKILKKLKNKEATSAVIPDGVTKIGNCAFFHCRDLKSVVIPAGVTSIGHSAFFSCPSLKYVVIPESVTEIAADAFFCAGLASAVFVDPNGWSVVKVPDDWSPKNKYADDPECVIRFSAEELQDPTFAARYLRGHDTYVWKKEACAQSTVKAVVQGHAENDALYVIVDNPTVGKMLIKMKDENATSAVIPEGVTAIGASAFANCTMLRTVTIPSSVRTIGNSAFFGCEKLSSVVIPANVTKIGDLAFVGCEGLSSVTIPSTVTDIGNRAFERCGKLTSVTIPANVTKIGEKAFSDCKDLESIVVEEGNENYYGEGNCLIERSSKTLVAGCKTSVIPHGVTAIDDGAFQGHNIVSVDIPEGVTCVGTCAFEFCSELSSVTIPASMAVIGRRAFLGASLTSAVFVDPNGWSAQGSRRDFVTFFAECVARNDGIRECRLPSEDLQDPADAARYLTHTCAFCTWKKKACRKHKSDDSSDFEFSDDGKTILKFKKCDDSSAAIPEGVTAIGAFAFANCTALRTVTIPSSVTTIAKGAFAWCENLSSVTVPASVKKIGIVAFYFCNALTSATFEDPNGWQADGAQLSAKDLQDPAIAAKFLTETHCHFVWTKEK